MALRAMVYLMGGISVACVVTGVCGAFLARTDQIRRVLPVPVGPGQTPVLPVVDTIPPPYGTFSLTFTNAGIYTYKAAQDIILPANTQVDATVDGRVQSGVPLVPWNDWSQAPPLTDVHHLLQIPLPVWSQARIIRSAGHVVAACPPTTAGHHVVSLTKKSNGGWALQPPTTHADFAFARRLGTVSHQAMVFSPDELRLYVSYDRSVSAVNRDLPFGRIISGISVFVRTLDVLLDSALSLSNSSTWTYRKELSLEIPLSGSMLGDVVERKDESKGELLKGEGFGRVLSASVDQFQLRRSLATSMMFPPSPMEGPLVLIYTENEGLERHELQQVLSLTPTLLVSVGCTVPWIQAQKYFGSHLVLHDQWLFTSLFPLPWILVWRRNNIQWSLYQALTLPVGLGVPTAEWLGSSLVLSPSGTQLVVGAPVVNTQTSTQETGGSVYLYTLQRTGDTADWVWLLSQRLSPRRSERSFGYFINMSHDGRLISISGNQRALRVDSTSQKDYVKLLNVSTSGLTSNSSAPVGLLWFVSLDLVASTLVASTGLRVDSFTWAVPVNTPSRANLLHGGYTFVSTVVDTPAPTRSDVVWIPRYTGEAVAPLYDDPTFGANVTFGYRSGADEYDVVAPHSVAGRFVSCTIRPVV